MLRSRAGTVAQSTCGASVSPRFLITIHARCRTAYDFPWWPGIRASWGWSVDRNVVSISVIGAGVAVHTYRPSAGSQKLMRGLDRRHAKTRCIQVPHLVFMVVRGGGVESRAESAEGKKMGKSSHHNTGGSS